MVHADHVYYRFTSEKKSGAPKQWGYRMYVSPVVGLQWQNENQVSDAFYLVTTYWSM
jgi:hypothetical protein